MFPGTSAPWHLPVQLNLDPSRNGGGRRGGEMGVQMGKWDGE